MERNAWWIAKELAQRIESAPVFNEYIHSFVTDNPTDAFFFNRVYINQFNKSSGVAQTETPGYFYCAKIMKFFKEHYRVGELYIEFVKDGCKEKDVRAHCNWCRDTELQGPVMYRVPEPHPDKDNEGHYMDVFRTPTDTLDGQPRPVDQFTPRANLKKLFGDDEISISNENEIKDFAAKYIVNEEHVKSYVKHLEELKACALMRTRERQRKKLLKEAKSFGDYNWTELVEMDSCHFSNQT